MAAKQEVPPGSAYGDAVVLNGGNRTGVIESWVANRSVLKPRNPVTLCWY